MLAVGVIASLFLQSTYIVIASTIQTATDIYAAVLLLLYAVTYMRVTRTYARAIADVLVGTKPWLAVLPFGLGFIGIVELQRTINTAQQAVNNETAVVNTNNTQPVFVSAPSQAAQAASTAASYSVAAPPATLDPANQATPTTGDDWQQGLTTLQPSTNIVSPESGAAPDLIAPDPQVVQPNAPAAGNAAAPTPPMPNPAVPPAPVQNQETVVDLHHGT